MTCPPRSAPPSRTAGDPVRRAIHLELPPRTDYLALVRRVVATCAALQGGLSERRTDELSLAISEACANAMDGQRATGSTDPVHVDIELGPDALVVTITDHAGGFSPDEIASPLVVEGADRLGRERGLGLPLMRDIADDLRFTRTDGGTAVRIEVRSPQ